MHTFSAARSKVAAGVARNILGLHRPQRSFILAARLTQRSSTPAVLLSRSITTSVRYNYSANASALLEAADRTNTRADSDYAAPAPADANASVDENDKTKFCFHQKDIHPKLYDALTRYPFKLDEMSPVQQRTFAYLPHINAAYDNKDSPEATQTPQDFFIKARTGTGKTIGFLVPALQKRIRYLQDARSDTDPNSYAAARKSVGLLVISPTRELAAQIAKDAIRLTAHLKRVNVTLAVGGANKGLQMRELSTNTPDVIVATPGRLLDLLRSIPAHQAAAFTQLQTLVLDEADMLLDMGFKKELDSIHQLIAPPSQRQTMLVSATTSPQVKQVARVFLSRDPTVIDVVPAGQSDTHDRIPQYCTIVKDPRDTLATIFKLIVADQLANPEAGKIIIFLPTTNYVRVLANILHYMRSHTPFKRDTKVHEIHAQLTQTQRRKVSDAFRQTRNTFDILVTTDVSARGVDYPKVTRVIQVGLPNKRDSYIHRLGRTGRAGAKGVGNIILQDFETGGMKNILSEFPLQNYSLQDLENDVSPSSESVATGLSELKDRILPDTDDRLIVSTMESLVGYYAPSGLVGRSTLASTIEEWTQSTFGLEEKPRLSARLRAQHALGGGSGSFGFDGGRHRGGGGGSRYNKGPRGTGFRSERNWGDRKVGERKYGKKNTPEDYELHFDPTLKPHSGY